MTILLFSMLLAKTGKAQSFSITGKVMDESGKPVAFASVFISKQRSLHNKPLAGKITAEDGSFKLTIDSAGSYIIKATYTSYHEFTKEIQVKAAMNLEPIILRKKENQLDVVTVTAQAPIITKKIDRIVMNVQNNALAAGKSSLELMNLAPGVFVNDGKISINGNPGTRVMVNGKLLQLTGDDLTNYLNGLRADEIQSMEVIAHPPAEYDAEGSGGYINIVLKKQKRAGFNGSVNAGYTQGRYANTNEGLQLNYKKDKLALFGSYSFDKTKNYEDSKFSRTINDSIRYRSVNNRVNNYTSHRVHVGGIYDIDSKQYIGVDYTGSFTNGTTPYNSTINITYPTAIKNQNVTGSYPRSNSRQYNNVGFNYHIVLDSVGSSFVFLSDYTNNNSKILSSAQSNFYDNNNAFLNDTSFRNRTPSQAKIYTADAKYTKAFDKVSAFSIGAKLTATRINNNATFESFDNNIWVNEPTLNYIYNYKESILAGYMNYSGRFLNTDVQLGLRGENTNTEGNLITSNIDTKRNYFNLFPTVFLKHGTNKSGSDYLTFYYGRRISRPSYSDLNPYEFNLDNYSIGRGNPYLQPSFTNSFEVGYTLHNKYSITASYDKQDAMIAQYAAQSPTDSLVTVYTHENFGKRTNTSIIIYAPIEITRWWSFNTNIILSRQRVSAQNILIQKNIANIQADQSFTLPDQFTISLNTRYYSNIISGNFLYDPIFTMDLGVQKKLYKNGLIIKATMSDIFHTYRLNSNVYYSNTNIGRSLQRRQTQTFALSLVYNFNLGKSFKLKKIESSNANEQSRLQ
jgi:iron complex outermembrane receptor protein